MITEIVMWDAVGDMDSFCLFRVKDENSDFWDYMTLQIINGIDGPDSHIFTPLHGCNKKYAFCEDQFSKYVQEYYKTHKDLSDDELKVMYLEAFKESVKAVE